MKKKIVYKNIYIFNIYLVVEIINVYDYQISILEMDISYINEVKFQFELSNRGFILIIHPIYNMSH
jgi:hypothetical protein